MNIFNLFRKQYKEDIDSLSTKYKASICYNSNYRCEGANIIKVDDMFWRENNGRHYFDTYVETSVKNGLLESIKANKMVVAFDVDSYKDAEIIYRYYKQHLGTAVDGIVFSRDIFNKEKYKF